MISAPLAPMAVIAGAGSGKSETMAARLVWLVANELVRPERVLGLTFTRKAAAELADRVRTRLDGLRRAGLSRRVRPDARPRRTTAAPQPAPRRPTLLCGRSGHLRPTTPTPGGWSPITRCARPGADAAADHAGRLLAARRPGGGRLRRARRTPWTGRRPRSPRPCSTLAGEMAEHLRDPGDVPTAGRWLDRALARLTGRVPQAVTDVLKTPADQGAAAAAGGRVCGREGGQGGHRLRRPDGARRPDRVPAPGGRRRPSGPATRWCCSTSTRTPRTRSWCCCGRCSAAGTRSPRSAIRASRSTAGAARARATCAASPPTSRAAAAARPRSRVLSTSFRNTGQRAGRRRDPAGAARGGAGRAACWSRRRPGPSAAQVPVRAAGIGRSRGRLGRRAGRRGCCSLPPGLAPDGGPWPDGSGDQVRPRDIAVLCRKRAQFAALRAALEARGIPVEVVGLGGLLTVPEVADIVATLQVMHDPAASARAGPAADLAALADRPGRPGRARPARQGARPAPARPRNRAAATAAARPGVAEAPGRTRPGRRALTMC